MTLETTARQRVVGNYCKWCGLDVKNARTNSHREAEYCSTQHARSAWKSRRKRRGRIPKVCPTPNKRNYYDRGELIVWAVINGQYGYLCGCGFYHITTQKPKHETDEASVIAKMIDAKTAEMIRLQDYNDPALLPLIYNEQLLSQTRSRKTAQNHAIVEKTAESGVSTASPEVLQHIETLWTAIQELGEAAKKMRQRVEALESHQLEFTNDQPCDTITTNDTESDVEIVSDEISTEARQKFRNWILGKNRQGY